ncbi:MAG: IPExxxVDY family protein [Bacteroidales bacterium]|jgi:hypothetical protein|nr:IPExxxVDY family protein [Bacteroidales bacterium]
MKATPKITRVQLKINQDNESVLLGIVSAEPDYKLSLLLNRKLKISLKNLSPLVLPNGSGGEIAFSRFSDSKSSPGLAYELISNRNGKNFLLKKLKNIDYIFHINNHDNESDISHLASLLRNTECITAVFSIDPASLKDKNLHYVTQ